MKKILNFRGTPLLLSVIFWCLAVIFGQWSIQYVFLALGLFLGSGVFYFENLNLQFGSWVSWAELKKNLQSLIFLIILLPVSLFILTSTGSLLGVGLIIGLNTSLCWRLLALKEDRGQLVAQFFSQLKRDPTEKEVSFLVWFWLVWTVILWLITLIS